MIIYPHDPRYIMHGRADQPTDSVVVREIFCENVYEVFDGDLSDTKIVVDIGANIGAFGIYMHSLDPDVKVYAFEPEQNNYDLLVENIKLNKLENTITPIKLGVGDENGVAYITNDGGDSKITVINGGEQIHTIRLQDWWKQQGKDFEFVDVLKIDVEGYEYQIIMDTPTDLFNLCRYITVEIDSVLNEVEFGEIVAKLSKTHQLKVIGKPNYGGYIYGKRY